MCRDSCVSSSKQQFDSNSFQAKHNFTNNYITVGLITVQGTLLGVTHLLQTFYEWTSTATTWSLMHITYGSLHCWYLCCYEWLLLFFGINIIIKKHLKPIWWRRCDDFCSYDTVYGLCPYGHFIASATLNSFNACLSTEICELKTEKQQYCKWSCETETAIKPPPWLII